MSANIGITELSYLEAKAAEAIDIIGLATARERDPEKMQELAIVKNLLAELVHEAATYKALASYYKCFYDMYQNEADKVRTDKKVTETVE